ncbi:MULTISPECIES: RagB/SusD family nutrient uptake outer membrane protein [Bizionia]|uniref:RagB/SusD family nutrient uptake outer membrane protein n=1 Tax=Bizionia algoritergicola TaxID=291187 RepID=A0A5D0QQX5_9FLAO|nr:MULTISPECIES: RagB/SusD family nutrient uptake outer membrane protein [Bizionia]OBX23230.1 hypothetical protein BAA08_05405 [Bizionia sp. APA-3]TYB71603.1 RagB/SusD family nutrient uptake outer membrane protein [Bizionia algoritergicola]
MKLNLIYKNYFKALGLFSLLLVTTLFFNCEDFIDVDLPDSQLTGQTVFDDLTTAEAAVTEIYSKMANTTLVCGTSSGLSVLLGNYADEIQPYNTGLQEYDFFQNTLISSHPQVGTLWNGSYNLIYAANSIIEGLENSTGIPEPDKERLLGEALFVRAFVHFYLVQIFGEIPYIATTDYLANSTVSRMSLTDVYAAIITDLEAANISLQDTGLTPFRLRPSRAAVSTLLARVNLYSFNWEAAEMAASAVISGDNLTWVPALEDVFLKTSTGTIWQLMRNQPGLPTYDAENFIFTLSPPPNRALSSHLIDVFELGDLRKSVWTGHVVDGSEVWYYPYKYKQFVPEAESREYSIIFRLEELYLIRAEARAHLGDIEGAQTDINTIRNRAGLGNTTASTEQALIEAILHERRIEFFSELGHRFFDLKRTGFLDATLNPIKPGWNSTGRLWPIPDSELLLNPNLLPQNPGY